MTPGLGFLATAAIGLAAYMGHVMLRGTKVSEFRQQWINDQRADLAIVISRARSIALRPAERWPNALVEMEEAAGRIDLRENPRTHDWKHVLGRIALLRDELGRATINETTVSLHLGRIVQIAQFLLKIEWDRVRGGEESTRRAQAWFIAGGIGITAVALFFELRAR